MSRTSVQDELVTVVMPARNEERAIGGALSSVQKQSYENLQIIVVDGISEDRTLDVVESIRSSDDRIEVVLNADRAIPFALNLGLAHARGRWLVRVDAHSEIPTDYVERLVAHLESGEWGGVGGRKDAVGHSPQGRAIAAVMGSRFAQGNSVYHYGTETQTVDHVPFGAYPVALARELGGWSEVQLVNEDFEFDYRVRRSGREILFDPGIRIRWDCRQRVVDLFAQYERYGAGKFQTLQTHPESLAARNLAAPGIVAVLALALSMLPFRRTRRLAIAMMLPYATVLAAGAGDVMPGLDDSSERRWVVPAFLAIHLGWGWGIWRSLLRASRGKRAFVSRHAASVGASRW